MDDALREQRDNQLIKLFMGHNRFGHGQIPKVVGDKILRVWIEKHSVECWKCLLVGYMTTVYVYVRSVSVENWLDGMSIGLGDDHSLNVHPLRV